MCVFAQGMLALTLFLFNWVWIPPANASGPECDFFDFDAMNGAAELTQSKQTWSSRVTNGRRERRVARRGFTMSISAEILRLGML
jgi:hypothetical protein